MAARTMWKGVIKIGRVSVPVKLYSAIEEQDVHFRLLHAKDNEPVKQQMVNPETGDVVPSDKIRKAYEDEDVLVILDDEELASLVPKESRDIEITRFLDPEDITPQWYDRPYYLGPDTSQGAYFALGEAMSRQNKVGIARWVMRKKEYVGALVPEGEYLMLITLRHADEVILADQLEPPVGRKPDPREVKLAEQLVSALDTEFNPGEFEDEFRERVLDFVDKKSKGRAPKVKKLQPKRESKAALTDVLEASLKAMQKERKSA